ncbi:MAG: hypothetical protein ACYC7A_19915 [Thermoanaerobaculia bacterium]
MIKTLLRTPGAGLRYLVEQDAFAVLRPLSADAFVRHCKGHGVDIDLERLERLERVRVFFPLARVEYPRIKMKVEHVGENRVRFHGMLQEGESWDGELREENSRFSFRRDWAASWLESGSLWDPRERPFEPWATFQREGTWEKRVESFYSTFQAFVLHGVLSWMTMRVPADLLSEWAPEEFATFGVTLSDWSTKVVAGAQDGLRSEGAAFLAQALANRYYFQTQGDRRTIQVSDDPFEKFDWREYVRAWNAAKVAGEIGVTAKDIADQQLDVAFLSKSADPLEHWYELVAFVALEKRERLKGKARFAQLGYTIEHMLRLFYRDLTGKDLRRPHERHEGVLVDETEERASLLKELEYLVNEYRLNPKPQLILVVEGDGEAAELPRIAHDLLGYDLAQLGIEVRNLRGIGNFTGSKKRDPYGALEKFIDDHHSRQTIVFCILDREGEAERTKKKLVEARSTFVPTRMLTCEEYVNLWNDSIEFDNFSDDEIASAMTRVSEDRYTFDAANVAAARQETAKSGNPLNTLYVSKLAYELNKVALLHELSSTLVERGLPENEDENRPIARLLLRAIELAALNHQPVTTDLWEYNQKSGYLGPLLPTPSQKP